MRTSVHRTPLWLWNSRGIHQRQRQRWCNRFHRQRTLWNARILLGGGEFLNIPRLHLLKSPDAFPYHPHPRLRRRGGASLWRRVDRGWRRGSLRRRAAGRPTLLDALRRPLLRSVRERCVHFLQPRHSETPHVAVLAVVFARISQAADGVDGISLIHTLVMVFVAHRLKHIYAITKKNKFEAKGSSNNKYCFEKEMISWGERLTASEWIMGQ